MERNEIDEVGTVPDVGPTSATTRFISPLVINSASRRRSLFSRPKAEEGTPRPASSGSASDTSVASFNTKIPRPAQRRPFTLSDAYQLAEEEEVARDSPSPAPRLWRSRRESAEERKAAKAGNPGLPNTPQRQGFGMKSRQPGRSGDHGEAAVPSQQSDLSDSTFDEKLRQYALDQTTPEEPGRRSNGLFSKSRLGTRIVETGKELLVRKSSRSSLDNQSSLHTAKATASPSPSLLRRLSGRMRESGGISSARTPIDWPELGDTELRNGRPQPGVGPLPEPGLVLSDSRTPNRNIAWQADADFTAGDLQVSTSPPVAIRRSNTKIDQIRALEAEVNRRSFASDLRQGDALGESPRSLESDIPAKSVAETSESQAIGDTMGARPGGKEISSSQRPVEEANVGSDGLRSREIDRLSKRALATATLDEFRDRDIGRSRSPSPDVGQRSDKGFVPVNSSLRDRLRRQEDETPAIAEHVDEVRHRLDATLSAPITYHPAARTTADTGRNGEAGDSQSSGSDVLPTNDKSSDRLRPLVTTAPVNSVGEARMAAGNAALAAGDRGLTDSTRRRRSIGGAKNDAKPTVGFIGLSRSSSVESTVAKRTSSARSDSDPTEQIEGEMKLFAPQENQSEKGSVRAPSPESDDGVSKETPKPNKVDPLSQPTPRVTGAFVDTPATVKAEKPESSGAGLALETKDDGPQAGRPRRPGDAKCADSPPLLPPGGKDGATVRQQKRAQSSRGDRVTGRSSSISARRRARSLSRSRMPLINSAKPPTVKDDLMEIQRANQIDDSTLDDIADLFAHQDQGGLLSGLRKVKSETNNSGKFGMEKELETYDRLSRSLETGLLGIRSAKQGIERLEDKVAHSDIKAQGQHKGSGSKVEEEPTPCRMCDVAEPPADAAMTYIHLPLPRLWYRRPKFRFTLLGLSLFLLSLWYILESWLCFRYCKPDYCYPGTACDWSAEDPVWGYAIPVKLDQWVTGGRGSAVAHRLRPEVTDWLADLWDIATGTDPATIDTTRLTWEQRRQHRRRLLRKGLPKPSLERSESEAVFGGWKSVRKATERTRAAQEMGYEVVHDGFIDADEGF